ncbi:hypothetical protein ACFC4S_26590 [Priestia megaterium]|uniref:hypothetical protein n=1 Tax=Priestia megaterium TaxID=1404 RepID=UPI001D44851F|nr:hypothetical protein [Priestia megaterium]
MKETTGKQTKSFTHNLIGYTVCVALVFIAFFTTVFVTLLFNDYAIRYEVIGWLYKNDIRFKTAVWLLEKVDPLLPYSREPSFEAVPEIPRQSSYGTW